MIYGLLAGNIVILSDLQGYFELVDLKRGVLQLARTLDYDHGPRNFQIEIIAKVTSILFLVVAFADVNSKCCNLT